MKQFTLRGLDVVLQARIKSKAKERHQSLNQTVLVLLQEALGLAPSTSRKKQAYHDLDALAGTWSREAADQFDRHLKEHRKIDSEMWS